MNTFIKRSIHLKPNSGRSVNQMLFNNTQMRLKSSATFAVPFKTTQSAAGAEMKKYKQMSAKDINVTPVMVPFYVYQMKVNVTFDIVASYYDPVTKATAKFSKAGAQTSINLDDKNQEMYFYAGTEYSRESIHAVVDKMRVVEMERTWDGLSDGCAQTYNDIVNNNYHFYMEMGGKTSPDVPSPMTDSMFPVIGKGGVDPFTIKPSYGAAFIKSTILPELSELVAKNYINSNPDLVLVSNNGTEEKKNLSDEAPFEFNIENMKVDVQDEGLHPIGGTVYFPVWVCDYKYGGNSFKSFINGSTFYHLETVEGSVHTTTQNSLYAGGTLTFASLCMGNSFEYIAIGDGSVFALTAVGMLLSYFAGAAHEFNQLGEALMKDRTASIHVLHSSSYDSKWEKELRQVRENQLKSSSGEHVSGESMRDEVSTEAIDHRLKTFTDHQMLGLIKSDSYDILDKNLAFRRQVMIWHPDHHKPHSRAEKMLSKIRDSYRRLVNRNDVKDKSKSYTMKKILNQNITPVKEASEETREQVKIRVARNDN